MSPTTSAPRTVVVVGAGVNGLTAAFYLARAGLRPLVIERAGRAGGAARTAQLASGVRAPAFAHAVGPFDREIAADAALARRGIRFIEPAVSSVSPAPDGDALVLWRDATLADAAIARQAPHDAAKYRAFMADLAAMGAALAGVMRRPPPPLDGARGGDMWQLLTAARALRSLGRDRFYRLLRWGPMPIADVVDDLFSCDRLKAAIAVRGVFASALGPRSAGSAAQVLIEAARAPDAPLAPVFVAGGPGALADALAQAAVEAGAELRCGADVAAVQVNDGTATGVVLGDGTEIAAAAVVSSLDPRRTLLDLVDPAWLDPAVRLRLRNVRASGTVARLTMILKGLPAFRDAAVRAGVPAEIMFGGRILVAPDIDTIERAFDASKYGSWSPRPWLECVVPTMADEDLAPAGTHVLSVYAQYAPYTLRSGTWETERDAFTKAVVDVLSEVSPDLPSRIESITALMPPDLERELGATGGHVHHGEMALDQLYLMRPMLGWPAHRTPIAGLYLCGAGTHPGGGITGVNGRNAARVVQRLHGAGFQPG